LSGEDVSTVLVTGGAGFIGSHVVDELVRSGCSVKVLDDLSAGRLENLGLHLRRGAVKFFEGDVRDQALMEKLVADVDAVVHLAALVSVPLSLKDPGLTFSVNVDGTRSLISSCCDCGVKKLVFASSCAVYGDPQYLPVDEGHPLSPLSPYASSKVEGERVCEEFAESSTADVVVLRLFNVYGPRQSSGEYGGVIAKFLERAEREEPLVVYGDGWQSRDFIHVGDVAEAMLTLLHSDEVEGVFNIGRGEAVTINDLVKKVLMVVGKDLKVVYEVARQGDISRSVADVSKAEDAFGFSPQMGLEDGLRNLFQWRKESGR
jgi:UDP-glucose 4-epimerase